MELSNYLVRYYPSVEITKYPHVYHDRYEHYLPREPGVPRSQPGHARTGPYDYGAFTRLKDDIEEHGVQNPFIIEHYCKDLPNAKGLRVAPVLAIRTGNNRAEVMHQLGISHGPALFVVPRTQQPNLPTDESVDIPFTRDFATHIGELWSEVIRGNDEPIGKPNAWNDSQLLVDIVQECGKLPPPYRVPC